MTTPSSSETPTCLELFEQARANSPSAAAIRFGSTQVSFEQLGRQSDELAHWLLHNRVEAGSNAVVFLRDRVQSVVALLGVLKAGCVYIPLHPDAPAPRLRKILEEVRPSAVVCGSDVLDPLSTVFEHHKDVVPCFVLGREPASRTGHNNLDLDQALPGALDLETLVGPLGSKPAYIYYTSGSTGEPKGIVGTIPALTQFVTWEAETIGVAPGWRVSQFMSPVFDAYLKDVFVALCSGATICIPPAEVNRLTSDQLAEWIDTTKINLIHCVSAVFSSLVSSIEETAAFDDLRTVVISGDAIHVANVERWMKKFSTRVKLMNQYGLTETTLIKFFHFIETEDLERGYIPIGRPILGATAVIVDQAGRPCPPGVMGEIYIRSPYLALGYFKDPELTGTCFVPNPFGNDPSDLVFKTGDLARLMADGTYQFCGRRDLLVKIRGIRVDMAEIENGLKGDATVKEAVVAAQVGDDGETKLVAYVLPHGSEAIDPDSLRENLRIELPEYMIPVAIEQVDEFPLTASGKLNRRALPALDLSERRSRKEMIAPRDPVEEAVAEVFKKFLGIEAIGVQDNLFELGGDSLIAIRVVSRIREELNVELTITSIFEAPTVEGLVLEILRLWTSNMSEEELSKFLAEPPNE
jgi:amino acid adenylation domain-containing protein